MGHMPKMWRSLEHMFVMIIIISWYTAVVHIFAVLNIDKQCIAALPYDMTCVPEAGIEARDK